jgi:hypothetical protein
MQDKEAMKEDEEELLDGRMPLLRGRVLLGLMGGLVPGKEGGRGRR